jgi:hypothetical protein
METRRVDEAVRGRMLFRLLFRTQDDSQLSWGESVSEVRWLEGKNQLLLALYFQMPDL